jgi:3-isopropylmalate/(R)-2-methylmalate dehydratase large subunit
MRRLSRFANHTVESMALTLFEKIWNRHVVSEFSDGRALIHIDRHVLQETTSWQAFDTLRDRGLKVRNPELTHSVIDHSVATHPGRTADSFPPTRDMILAMRRHCAEFGLRLYDIDSDRQGIVHVISPELGIAQPGCTLVCADSHTATSGGLGAWAWGIGTTQVLHVLATQMLLLRKPRTMRVTFNGAPGRGVFAKDLILHLIGQHGVATGTGHVVEYAGPAIRALPIEGRLTVCNMSIEFGARAGLIAADDTTFQYLWGREFAPKGAAWDAALTEWRGLPSDDGARYDQELVVDCDAIAPRVTWGNSPQDVIAIDGRIPAPDSFVDPDRRAMAERALRYMDLTPGAPIEGTPIDYAFIGSCTNARLSDLREAASIARGRQVAPGVRALIVPGSTTVKREAEAIGLDTIFRDAGFEWRESACSMCVAANGDMVPPGKRSISTTNRNFEGRQGPGSRTHLASPAMVAAAAVTGKIMDVRRLLDPGEA